MSDLPTGTITFLLTDVEGSTTRWERHPEQMRVALARHDALIETLTARHGGVVVRPRGEGDSRFCVFAQPSDAVAAAVAIQQALSGEPWPAETPISVRIAVHTGHAEVREGDYYGSDVNRAARLRAAGHGGQTLLSGATVARLGGALAGDALPAGTTLRDVGERRLKDLIQPEHVYELVVAGLPDTFPPLATLDMRPHNLPVQATPLVGRERQVREVRERLLHPEVRLLTLTGPGGVGKTRLALQVAAEVLDDFDHGVWFVSLAPLTDPALVRSAMAQVLGVKEGPGQPLEQALTAFLRERHLLLVLDNFEQVVAAAAHVSALLAACPHLKVLVTSRAVLKVYGEQEYPIPPLTLPPHERLPGPSALAQYEAVALFLQRAQAARPGFAMTEETAPVVAEICTRLDGLPLAIELAAARSKLLPPPQLLERLHHRFGLLTGGARDLPARQQTLRGTIDWSYQLLDPAEQTHLARLAVFVGGCTLAAAEAVCAASGDLPLDVLEGLAALVDKSLLKQEEGVGGAARFWMLETVREYALERLDERSAAAALRQRHAAYFLALAEQAEPALRGPQQVVWGQRLAQDLDNLRAALQWALDQGERELALRLSGALPMFWEQQGRLGEGRRWLAVALADRGEAPAAVQAKALTVAGELAWVQGDLAQGRDLLQQGVARCRAVGDRWWLGLALSHLGGVTLAQGDLVRARAWWEESAACFRAVGDRWGLGLALNGLAAMVSAQGEGAAAARRRHEEGIALLRAVGDRWYLALALSFAGDLALVQEDYAAAGAWFEEGLAAARAFGNSHYTSYNLAGAATVALFRGDHSRAARLFREHLALVRDLGSKRGLVASLTGLAGAAGGQGRAARAARLLGAADALQTAVGFACDAAEQAVHDRATAGARREQDEAAFARAYAAGQALSLEQAITYALEDAPEATEQAPRRLSSI